MNNFTYTRPDTVGDAYSIVHRDANARYIAGGTNLIDLWKYNLVKPTALVDLNRAGCNEIVEINDGIRLGAGATNAETAYHPLVEQRYPMLSKAILAGASGQIRNMATNGGNLMQRTRCYYFYDADFPCNKRVPGSGCPAIDGYNRMHAILGASEHCIAVFPSDMCVALAALDARVNTTGRMGNREILLKDFHRLPGNTPHLDNNIDRDEVITSIDLPSKGFADHYSYLKLRDRNSYAFALVSVATGIELQDGVITDVRIALGGVAHKPWRITEAEEFLKGQHADAASFDKAADILLQGARGYQHNSFKIQLAKKAIVRNCQMALSPNSEKHDTQPQG